jgi:hypothetical protein
MAKTFFCHLLMAYFLFVPRAQPVYQQAPVGKAPIGKTPIGKAPIGKAPLVTRG